MGSGTSRKQSNCNGAPVSGIIYKTTALAPPECQALEEEVRWLRRKLEEEQREKEWMMSRQAPASSSTATQNGAAPLFLGPEEDLVWLRRNWDVEKKEKAWMMARFEAIEAQLKTKNEECSALRLLINPNRTASPSEFRDGTPMIGLPAPELRDAASKPGLPGQPVVNQVSPTGVDPVSPIGVDPASPISPNSSGKLSLKERRGLKLGVTTSGLANNNTVGPAVCVNDRSGTSVVEQSDSSIDKKSRAVSFDGVPTLGPREVMGPAVSLPAQRSTFNYNNSMEPASPLLARRMKSPKSADVRQPLAMPEPESPKLSMRVDAVKVSSFDMVPASPKRAKRRNDDFGEVTRMRSHSSVPFLAQVDEDVEAEQRQHSPTL